jgi:hypothetical protein
MGYLLFVHQLLTAYRQKEILRQLGSLKTEAALKKNIGKVIALLQDKTIV